MEISILLAAFLLGLSASPNCLAVCMPVMVPMITSDKESSPKRGFYFSIYFSLGRLLVYLLFAAIIGYIGYSLLDLDPVDEASGGELAARIIMTIIAIVIITYAILLYQGRIPPVTCPRCLFPKIIHGQNEDRENEKDAVGKNGKVKGCRTGKVEGCMEKDEDKKKVNIEDNEYKDPSMVEIPDDSIKGPPAESHRENTKVRSIPVVFGFLFGSIVCPPFLILLGTALISSGPFTAMLAALLFWIGTLPVNLFAGAFSGGFGRRWRKKSENEPSYFVTNVSAITLMMVGIWWLFLVLV